MRRIRVSKVATPRTDRGIVAILDKRIVTKYYGRQFVRSLPDCPRFPTLESVERWWNGEPSRSR